MGNHRPKIEHVQIPIKLFHQKNCALENDNFIKVLPPTQFYNENILDCYYVKVLTASHKLYDVNLAQYVPLCVHT